MFAIKRPTKTVDIVTDLDALNQAVELKQQIDDATPNTSVMTEAEIGAAVKTQNTLRRELKAKLKTIDESTVTFTLRGLGSSQWNQIVLATTTVDQKTGKQERDINGLLMEALPAMIVNTEQHGEPVEFDPAADVPALLDAIVDTQTVELLVAVQQLNTPQVEVPKALRE
ncbi:hypothetical protein [Bifidobacterium pseudolongum]|uniref:Uncharacterized protein n=1 Tax=Bifidobacterium pseudolongum TaxID=1694 RepID=A0A395XEF3_9BIFI|nr:hypothetical protein [Bifidobacterium pseudolongum]RGW07031.1 hypothetical protein DWV92_09450 [Bifidobacterium pseudolongum]